MQPPAWTKKFLGSTRGRVVQLLREGERSVNDLAAVLSVTDNAVRAHLATLERDGLVRQTGERPGVRKPEALFGLTPQAELLFPKAYDLVLRILLDTLSSRLAPDEVEAVLEEVGRRIATLHEGLDQSRPLRERVDRACHLLQQMGGLAEVHEQPEQFVIRGRSCPLTAAVDGHPEVCRLAESLLAEYIGAPVREACDRSGAPRCAFTVQKA